MLLDHLKFPLSPRVLTVRQRRAIVKHQQLHAFYGRKADFEDVRRFAIELEAAGQRFFANPANPEPGVINIRLG